MERSSRNIKITAQFKSDLKKAARSGRYQVSELMIIVEKLAKSEELLDKHQEHSLVGNWIHHRECHIRPNWLLIYKFESDNLWRVRTGSHAELFG